MSTNGDTATKLPRPRSATVFDGPDRAHSRAYMKGIGFDDDALSRPTIGIANTWTEAMPCNFHLRGLAEHVKAGVRAAGGTPMEFNTVAVSDGVTMGTQGMKASLVSREVIADSIELMARGYQFDAIVALCACDKTIPGCAMALARLDVPSVLLYGGSIAPGHWHGRDVTILDIFEAIGAHNAGNMSDEELNELEGVASPGAGACGGQFTANTMACAFEALGISAGGSAMVPAEDDDKPTVAEKIGELVINVLVDDLRPSKILTRDSLENAIACVCASGGSTNAVLHLIALAHEVGIELTMDDFERISRNTPLYADLKPGGRFVATDLYAAGGVPVILKRLAKAGILHGDAITVTGRTIGEEAAAATEAPGQEVVRQVEDPLKPEGGLAILRGNLAPEGAVLMSLAGRQLPPGSARLEPYQNWLLHDAFYSPPRALNPIPWAAFVLADPASASRWRTYSACSAPTSTTGRCWPNPRSSCTARWPRTPTTRSAAWSSRWSAAGPGGSAPSTRITCRFDLFSGGAPAATVTNVFAIPREPKGRGAVWTEERETSDEGRQHQKSGPEASGEK